MASPQLQNGFTQIANELLEAFAKIRIAGQARQVLDVIIRKVYGFHKPNDAISMSQFTLATGLSDTTVCKCINILLRLNLITKKGNKIANIYRINKDYSTWKPLPKKVTLPKKEKAITNKGKNYYPKREIQKILSKENITKEKSDGTSREVIILLNQFKNTINPHLNFGNKTERKAAADLINAYGLQQVIEAVRVVAEKQPTEKFMPKVISPYELWTKWAKLKIFFSSNNNPKRKIWTTK